MSNNPYQPSESEGNDDLPGTYVRMSWMARIFGVVVLGVSAIRLYRDLGVIIPFVLEENFQIIFQLVATYTAMVTLLMALFGMAFFYSSARWRNQRLRSALWSLLLPIVGVIACLYLDSVIFSL